MRISYISDWSTVEVYNNVGSDWIRYALVRLSESRIAPEQIASLGHELQHAIEIAERPDIVDSTTLARAYERSGVRWRTGPSRVNFDTATAIDTGNAIWRELVLRADGE